ncbi:MAG: M48 family peptidase [Chloroflexi bacterium]|nr:MAG: M48 family peptidase [Chloroflexota bacterium]
MVSRGVSRGRGSGISGRLLMGAVLVVISLITYFGSQSTNPVTQDVQHISMSTDQEIAMGLQAAPELSDQFGGLDPNQSDQQRVQEIGQRIVQDSPASTTPYQYAYHLLADPQTVNAFALPGGQVFITRALYDQLQTDGELASILGHETGHVVARHSAEQIAKAQLTEGLTGAAVIAACNPDNPNGCVAASQMAAIVGQLIGMKYSRADETEADWLGVCFMNDSGYDPQDMVKVMQILDSLSQEQSPPEFLSTHPDPGNRILQIQADIQNMDQCP